MPPKKAATATKKASSAAPAHATYQDMIKEAIINLKDRQGSSRQALKKYVLANNNLSATEAAFTSQFNRALTKGSESGVFERPKGPSGPVKIAKAKAGSPPATKKAETKKAAEPKATKAAPKTAAKAKRTTAVKDAPAAKAPAKKAAATKKAPAKAAAGKKTATTKANVSKVRKSAPAPAVEETKPVILGKTKSGRVTKSTAPSAPATKAAAAAKKAAPKKATPKKK